MNSLRLTVLLSLVAASVFAHRVFADDVSFSAEQPIINGFDGASVTAGDLDADGAPDLFALAESSAELRYAINGGDGSTWAVTNLPNGSRPRRTDLGDLDGDGDLDLVFSNYNTREVFWVPNDLAVSGTFLDRRRIVRWGRPDGIFVIDVDGDTDLDVVVANRFSRAFLWQENLNGDASSWAQRTIATDYFAASVVWAGDIDGDGDVDVVGSNERDDSGRLAVFLNTSGTGTAWTSLDVADAFITAITGADIDHDGDIDIVVQESDSGPATTNLIAWWENTSGDASTWSKRVVDPEIAAAEKGLQAVDVDLDGDLDIVGNSEGFWYDNAAGDGSSWVKRSHKGGAGINISDLRDTAVADVDGDGDTDILGTRRDSDRVSWWQSLLCSPSDPDDDSDGARNGCDVCPGSDDRVDSDADSVPDGCDACPGGDDRVDTDDNGIPDACDGVSAFVSIDDVSAAEGDSGSTIFTFTVSVTGSPTGAFDLPYSTTDDSATTADADYVASSGTLSFAGSTDETQTLSVTVNGDTTEEADETFLVELGEPDEESIAVSDGSGLGTILNDDITPAFLSIDDVSASEGDSGTTNFTFTVLLSGSATEPFTVSYSTADGTATTADNDYLPTSGTLSFAGTDGESQTITVVVNGDTSLEQNESFTVNLGTPTGSNVSNSDGSGQGTIQNDDSATLSINDVAQVETNAGTVDFVFTVTLSGTAPGGFTVGYTTADGTATTTDGDYAASSGTLTFAGTDGETETVTVTVNGDAVVESDEVFTVELGSPSVFGVTASDGSGQGTIENDDSATLSIDDVSRAEGDAGNQDFVFTVTLSGEVDGGFTVPFSTSDGSATTGDGDYGAASGTLSFEGSNGETKTISVEVNGDGVVEPDETLTVSLGSPSVSGVAESDGSGLGTISNDDASSISIDDVSQLETDAGTTQLVFTVTLSEAVQDGFSVSYSTHDGSATAGVDYQAASGTLTFAGTAGETESITVTVNGDTALEADETFSVDLGAPSNASVAASDDSGQGTIENDDAASISIDDVTRSEGDAGTSSFSFTVTLDGEVEEAFTVQYSTNDGSATTADSDYVATSGALTFSGNDGETETIVVVVNGDTVVETDETFTVELGTPSNPLVTVSGGSALGTIQNDDTATLSIADASTLEGDKGAIDLLFTVTLEGSVASTFSVPFATADGSATTSDADYNAVSGSLIFGGTSGQTQTITVTVNGDSVIEPDESMTVTLGTPTSTGVTVTDGSAEGTIENDDSAMLVIDSVSEVEGDEGGLTAFVFAVSLSGEVVGGFTVDYATADGTATTADDDYRATTGSLTFTGSDGETQSITVLVDGDATPEADEIFTVELGTPSSGSVTVADGSGEATIQNDDAASIAIADRVAAEGNAGTTGFTFPVTLTGDVGSAFTVSYATADGTATTADSDYVATSGVLTFAGSDGEIQTITVVVNGDVEPEPDEVFTVRLGTPPDPRVVVADGTAAGTIADDDVVLTVEVEGMGNVTSSPAGIDCGDAGGDGGSDTVEDCAEVYDAGTVVDLNATPAAGWSFDRWSGDFGCSSGSVTMSFPKTCTATFVAPEGQIAIGFDGDGFGVVTSTPAGIDCDRDGAPSQCSAVFDTGTEVTLGVEVTSLDTTFDGWAGDADCADGAVTVLGGDQVDCVAILTVTPLFADGFESGATLRWSATVPPIASATASSPLP